MQLAKLTTAALATIAFLAHIVGMYEPQTLISVYLGTENIEDARGLTSSIISLALGFIVAINIEKQLNRLSRFGRRMFKKAFSKRRMKRWWTSIKNLFITKPAQKRTASK